MSMSLRSNRRTPKKPAKFADFDTHFDVKTSPSVEKKPTSPEKSFKSKTKPAAANQRNVDKEKKSTRGKKVLSIDGGHSVDEGKKEELSDETKKGKQLRKSQRGKNVKKEEVQEDEVREKRAPEINEGNEGEKQLKDLRGKSKSVKNNREERENVESVDGTNSTNKEQSGMEEGSWNTKSDEAEGEEDSDVKLQVYFEEKIEDENEETVEVRLKGDGQLGRMKLEVNSQVFVPYMRDDGVTGLKQCVVVESEGEVYLDDLKHEAVDSTMVVEEIEVDMEDDGCTEAETAEQLLRLSQEKALDVPLVKEENNSHYMQVCQLCNRTFASEKSMRTHQRMRCKMRTMKDLRPFKCNVCGIGRITKDDLRKHMVTHGEKVKEDNVMRVDVLLECSECPEVFVSPSKYQRHRAMHAFSCSICHKKFRREEALEEHKQWHVRFPIECMLCNAIVDSAESLTEHEGEHPGKKAFKCGAVGVQIFTMDEVKDQLKRWHDLENKGHSCEYCGKKFQRKPAMMDHIRIHTGEKPFTCSICDRAFTLKNTLKMHMMRHEGVKPHTCATCGKQFVSRFMLSEHMRTHTGEKPYSCDICGKTFCTKPNLVAHVKLHSGSRPYKCSYCDTAFTSKAKMLMHEDSHRGEIKHFCPYCNKGFVRKDSMISHQRIHRIKRKSCACEVCGNRYSSPAALKVHLRKHQDVKPYECSICGKPYTRSDVWKKHLEWHMRQNDGDQHSGGNLDVISVPQQEDGDVQIVVDDDVHIVVDQQTDEGTQRVQIPLSVIVNGNNTAMAVPENAEISIMRKNSYGETTIQELHEII